MPETLVEIWQANACGRYRHAGDQHPAPLDPNFEGMGRCLTDAEGRFKFITIKPGAYPWGNHENAWRPQHIHFSVFGRAFTQRLVTQMYFPGDPLFEYDPIFNSVRDEQARRRMICAFDLARHQAGLGAGVPLRHRPARRDDPVRMSITPAQTVGPYFSIGLPWPDGPEVVPGRRRRDPRAVLDGEREPIPDALIETWQADPSGALRGRGLPRLRALPDRRERGEWAIRTVKPGAVGDQAPHIAVARVRPRAARPRGDAHLLPGGRRRARGDPVLSGLERGGAGDADRGRARRTDTVSTCASRVPMRPSSSPSEGRRAGRRTSSSRSSAGWRSSARSTSTTPS